MINYKIKNSIFLLILTIITFLVGIYFNNSSEGRSLLVRLIILLLGSIPFIFSIFAIAFYYKKPKVFEDIVEHILVKIGLISCIFIYYLIAGFFCIIIEVACPVTDINSYKKIVYDDLLEYFPKDIPQNAVNAQFYFSPAFLQAGEYLHLYYVDETMTSKLFVEKYHDKAILASDEKLHSMMSSPLLEKRDDLNDFIIYIIKNESKDQSYPYPPEFILVAFNEKTKELFYKYEMRG